VTSGQKRKSVQVYRAKTTPMLTAEAVHPLALVVREGGSAPVDDEQTDVESNDSNKKRRSLTKGSAD
jgi:hypothetical protein